MRRKPMSERDKRYIIAAICQNSEALNRLLYGGQGPKMSSITYYHARQAELRAQLNRN